MPKIRVLLADHHIATLNQIRLELGGDFEIVGAVRNGRDAVDAVFTLAPDVLVTDISVPIVNGLQAATRLRRANSRTRVVFLTIHTDPDFVAAALSSGAYGYVTKAHMSTDLAPAIHEAMDGHVYVSRSARN